MQMPCSKIAVDTHILQTEEITSQNDIPHLVKKRKKDWEKQRTWDFYTDMKVVLHILYSSLLRITGRLWCQTTVLSVFIGNSWHAGSIGRACRWYCF